LNNVKASRFALRLEGRLDRSVHSKNRTTIVVRFLLCLIHHLFMHAQYTSRVTVLRGNHKNHMSILAWIILGGVAGWLASLVMNTDQSQGIFLNIIIGIVGAFLGGLAFSLFGGEGVTGFNLYSLLVALLGSVLLIGVLKAVRG
jgi:uncharacterized membrane protein YeaQ/YmgE (transglycosylase-associated protein family)